MMVDDVIRLRDVVQVELEQLEQYGEAAAEFFHELSGDIRQDFTGTLEQLLTQELPKFQSQVAEMMATGSTSRGYGALGGMLGGMLGNVVSQSLPDSLYGNVFGAAVGHAVRTAVQDIARYGTLDAGRIIQSANRGGQQRLDSVLRQGELPLSSTQRGAEMLGQLDRAQRNR